MFNTEPFMLQTIVYLRITSTLCDIKYVKQGLFPSQLPDTRVNFVHIYVLVEFFVELNISGCVFFSGHPVCFWMGRNN